VARLKIPRATENRGPYTYVQKERGQTMQEIWQKQTALECLQHRSRIRYLSKKNLRILTNFPTLKKLVKIR